MSLDFKAKCVEREGSLAVFSSTICATIVYWNKRGAWTILKETFWKCVFSQLILMILFSLLESTVVSITAENINLLCIKYSFWNFLWLFGLITSKIKLIKGGYELPACIIAKMSCPACIALGRDTANACKTFYSFNTSFFICSSFGDEKKHYFVYDSMTLIIFIKSGLKVRHARKKNHRIDG